MAEQYTAEQLVATAQDALRVIGYRGGLLRTQYRFADVMAPSNIAREVDLAAFAQEPPDYRNACLGVVVLEQSNPEAMQQYLSLGAPQVLGLYPQKSEARLWKMIAKGPPQLIERIDASYLHQAIMERRHEWRPDEVLRAKSIGFQNSPTQTDIFDTGLIPALEEIVYSKLDRLLKDAIASSVSVYREHYGEEPNYPSLFHLIFRLLAAKVLIDRQYPGSEAWADSDAQIVLQSVEGIYFRRGTSSTMLPDREVQRIAWNAIRNGFHLQNISVEALAFVFENTLISGETRKQYNTHATPHGVAEYVVRHLPFENLPREERIIFEPFAGHAPFLIAAMGKLRSILPEDITVAERHEYFVKMLSGMEGDPFAFEDAYASLMLADYPNPNGWDIRLDDVFSSSYFDQYLARARVVLCNPPFSEFSLEERKKYSSVSSPYKAVEALRRVLSNPPMMLGFVLPRTFIDGRSFRDLGRKLDAEYNYITLVELPDKTFQYSEAETVLVIAHGKRTDQPHRRSEIVKDVDLQSFLRNGKVSAEYDWQVDTPDVDEDLILWRTPLLRRVWTELADRPRLGEVAFIHRGVEYKGNIANFISKTPEAGFVPGLATVSQGLEPYIVSSFVYLSRNPQHMRRNAHVYEWDRPKVVAPAARTSRGPWRLLGAVDEHGLMFSQRFQGIWPKGDLPVEVLAAVLSGPVANAFVSTRTSGRDNTIDIMKKIPVPSFTNIQIKNIISLIREYRTYRVRWIEQPERDNFFRGLCYDVQQQIDLEILAAYNLESSVEHELLAYFAGYQRPGPVRFTGYFPESVSSDLSLRGFTESETTRVLIDLDQLAEEIGDVLPEDISAVDAVREVRREL